MKRQALQDANNVTFYFEPQPNPSSPIATSAIWPSSHAPLLDLCVSSLRGGFPKGGEDSPFGLYFGRTGFSPCGKAWRAPRSPAVPQPRGVLAPQSRSCTAAKLKVIMRIATRFVRVILAKLTSPVIRSKFNGGFPKGMGQGW